MKLKLLLIAAALAATLALVRQISREDDPRAQHAALAENLLVAMEQLDYDRFVRHADKALRRLKRADFEALAAQNTARLKGGHTLAFVSESERSGVRLSRWKVGLKSGEPDALLTLGVRDGEVAMFALR
jgi:hypothetical protein